MSRGPSNDQFRDVSEDPFYEQDRYLDTFYVLKESYDRGRGRTLDPEQVKVLFETIAQLSESLNECSAQLQEERNASAEETSG